MRKSGEMQGYGFLHRAILVSMGQKHVRYLLSLYIFTGRSIRAIVLELIRRAGDCLGWLSGAPRKQGLQRFAKRWLLLRDPRRWHFGALGLVTVVTWVQVGKFIQDHASGRSAQRRKIRKAISTCDDPEKWRKLVSELQLLSKRTDASMKGSTSEAKLYDEQLIKQRTDHLKKTRENCNSLELMFSVRADLIRNLGGMASTELHERLLMIPTPIEAYIDEVKKCLRHITSASDVKLDDRLAFLRETRHAFGRTALVLSGGGSFGAFHLGVLKALLEQQLLPRVLSGSSAGSIVAALVCTRTDVELSELFSSLETQINQLNIDFYSSNSATQIVHHLMLKGVAQDYTVLQERLQRLLGDVTFAEAHERSGRVLNVSISAADTAEPPRLLNYLTAPDVLVWSAVAASSAFPLLFDPQTLIARDPQGQIVQFANQGAAGEVQRRWRDGSLEEDLPMRGLSEMFSVNYFVVSQANPYLLPIIAMKDSLPRVMGALAESEFKHRCKQMMDLLPRRFGGSRILKLLSQPWQGDITMFMPVNSLNALKAIVNLSKEDLLRAVNEGQRSTWARLPSIAANCEIEVVLDQCLLEVTMEVRKRRKGLARPWRASALQVSELSKSFQGVDLPTLDEKTIHENGITIANHEDSEGVALSENEKLKGNIRRGIPSWMHLQSLGIPAAGSYEALGGIFRNISDHHLHSPDELQESMCTSISSNSLAIKGTQVENMKDRKLSSACLHLPSKKSGLDEDIGSRDHEIETAHRRSAEIDTSAFPPGELCIPYSKSLPCMDDVWLELFSLAPKAQIIPTSGGQGLDVIAP